MSKRSAQRRRVMIVTGSRSEFGLLRPVMEAVRKNKKLALQVVAAGEHLLAPAHTWREVEGAFGIDAKVPMQKKGDKGRAAHAAACGRGLEGFASVIRKLKPDWVVVLGDRIEAFAAASAASIAGVAVCHIHGGDRAEGIADEAMRHAITKLAHLHCAATNHSARRIVKMGEPKQHVHLTGSPAIDGVNSIRALSNAQVARLCGSTAPFVVLLHPSGLSPDVEEAVADEIALFATATNATVFLHPNSDPGAETIRSVWAKRSRESPYAAVVPHIPRAKFLGLLKHLAQHPGEGLLIGNSSAGIIEAASLGVAVINVGPRQAGRERGDNVMDVRVGTGRLNRDKLWNALERAWDKIVESKKVPRRRHPYGDGRAGPRIAALLAKTDPHDPALLRKRMAY